MDAAIELPEHYIEVQRSLVQRRLRTLKHGDAFAVSDDYGDIGVISGGPEGLYFNNTRFLSWYGLRFEGKRPLLLSSVVEDDNAALSVNLANPDVHADGVISLPRDTIAIERTKFLWQAVCYERIGFRNYADSTRHFRIDIGHGAMVFVTGIRQNTNHMFAGVDDASWTGFPLFVLAMAILTIAWLAASPYTIRHARLVQRAGSFMVGWVMGLAEGWDPRSQLTQKDISPYFWPNGTMPNSKEFDDLVADGFASYRLRISGLVEAPRDLSLADLKAMVKQDQITTHFCIQGWSGVAEWGGVPMHEILDLVKPMPEARYAVFYSLADGGDGGRYYDVHRIENMRHALTILAYEMNGAPVSVLHGAPLRLRCENELGFKTVKWIVAIEFVSDFADLGAGQGGYNEDHEFYGYRMPI